jgi:RimJ/RimL family protein N-acetyltransferase
VPLTLPDVVPAGAVLLRRLRAGDAVALVEAYAASLPDLARWFSWAQTVPTVDSQSTRLRAADHDFGAGTDFHFAITHDGELVGELRVNPRAGPRVAAIGYWVHSGHHRQEFATAATRASTTATFAHLPDIDRVEIHMDQANVASVGVARAVGYRLDREVDRDVLAPRHTGRGYVWATTRARWTAQVTRG